MYYWKDKTDNSLTLSEELMTAETVTSVKIATAFISDTGYNIIKQLRDKYNLARNDVVLYLSRQFSAQSPGDLLESINGLCRTKLFLSENLHSKVYLIQGSDNKLIFGSSNLTNGGFGGNIEFDYICIPTRDELKSVLEFFDFCERKSTEVDNQIIAYYKRIQEDLNEFVKKQRKIDRLLSGYKKKDDAFTPDDYDIDEYFFTYNDYETFFKRNAHELNNEIRTRRKAVREKILSIHERVYPSIRKLGLYCHKREDNITSLITLNVFNMHKVEWIGVRYGKSPAEVDMWNEYKERDEDGYGFQKHGCLQFCIYSKGFDIQFHLAVRNEAIDRMMLRDNNYRLLKERRTRIESELNKLKGEDFHWGIYNDETWREFYIDKEPIETFCEWFMQNDEDGKEIYFNKYYKPDNAILKDIDSISKEVIRVIIKLEPLYNAMVWRPSITS